MIRRPKGFQAGNTALGAIALVLVMFAASCARSEAPPVAEGETSEAATTAAANAPAEGGVQGAGGSVAPNAVAPATSRPASSSGGQTATRPASQTASQPAGRAASNSATSGWGDQPVKSMQTQPAAPPAPVVKTYTLPAGSRLRVRTASTMSSKALETGDTFTASLAEPIEVDGRVIAERGASVAGRVVSSDPGGRVKGKASLEIALTKVQLVNGEMANVSTSAFSQEAASGTKKDATKVAIGSGIGAAIGAIAGGGKGAAIGAGVGAGAGTGAVLATRGADAVIPAESLINFSTQSALSVKLP